MSLTDDANRSIGEIVVVLDLHQLTFLRLHP